MTAYLIVALWCIGAVVVTAHRFRSEMRHTHKPGPSLREAHRAQIRQQRERCAQIDHELCARYEHHH